MEEKNEDMEVGQEEDEIEEIRKNKKGTWRRMKKRIRKLILNEQDGRRIKKRRKA